jgi:hypothetical protein
MTASNPDPDRIQPTADDVARDIAVTNTVRPPADREVPATRYDGKPADVPAERAALFEPGVLNDFNSRWSEIQTGFVDEPRSAVERADKLVADVLKQLADGFAKERTTLEQQWNRGDNVTTEDLRLTLQRYRSFFDRLLSLE